MPRGGNVWIFGEEEWERDCMVASNEIAWWALYMEACYPTGRVTRQRRDPGCYIKVLFCRLTIYMGQAGNLPRRDLGKKSRDLG